MAQFGMNYPGSRSGLKSLKMWFFRSVFVNRL